MKPTRSKRVVAWVMAVAMTLAACATLWVWSRRQTSSNALTGPTPAQIRKADAAAFAGYAGSSSCQDCHQQAFAHWQQSHHALAERAIDPARDREAFDPARSFPHGSQTSEVNVARGRFEIATTGLDGKRKPFAAERVIGVDPLRQFLVAGPGGRFQVTEVAVDSARGEWFDVFGNEDRRPGEWGHWTGRGMTWNSMCAACHNTQLRKNYLPSTDSYATAMAERSVGCEACHGPLADHVRWQQQHRDQPRPDPSIHRLDKNQMLDTCGSCHSRRAELTGEFRPGENFLDHYSLTIPDETELFYADGQVRDEDYEYASFLGSRMHTAGVRCLDCHDPHSAKPLADNNTLCLRCHGPPLPPAKKIDPATHTHHQPGTPGDRCVDCHMPTTVYMQRHARRDHGFTIPDPLLTKELGIPNACNRCHTDRDADWALAAAQQWYGHPNRARARTIAAARAAQPSARDGLLKLAREETNSLWRAVATGLLKHWNDEPFVTAALLERLGDNDPLVRDAAARALENFSTPLDGAVQSALRRALNDPVRAVRVDAAWALRAGIETNSPATQDLLACLRHNSEQPAGLLQIGVWHIDRGDLDAALVCFHRAIEWDSRSAPLHSALAVALSLKGKQDEAVRALEEACRLAPREADYRFKLALAFNEVGKLAEATTALEQAVKLEPQFARAWYNLGLAYASTGKPDRALAALARAESIDVTSPQFPYARATILAQLGRVAEARAAAQRALVLQPSFSEAAALLQTLGP